MCWFLHQDTPRECFVRLVDCPIGFAEKGSGLYHKLGSRSRNQFVTGDERFHWAFWYVRPGRRCERCVYLVAEVAVSGLGGRQSEFGRERAGAAGELIRALAAS